MNKDSEKQTDLIGKRVARTGKNEGKEFWGCSGYPECKVTKEIDK